MVGSRAVTFPSVFFVKPMSGKDSFWKKIKPLPDALGTSVGSEDQKKFCPTKDSVVVTMWSPRPSRGEGG
jgi:hypothetical protein